MFSYKRTRYVFAGTRGKGFTAVAVREPHHLYDGWVTELNNGATMLDGSKFDLSRVLIMCSRSFFWHMNNTRHVEEFHEVVAHEKVCSYCGSKMRRKRFTNGSLESPDAFSFRKYCGRECYESTYKVRNVE